MRYRILIALAVAISALTPPAGLAQETAPVQRHVEIDVWKRRQTEAENDIKTDGELVGFAAMSTGFEIRSSELLRARTDDAALRKLADDIILDHDRARLLLGAAAAKERLQVVVTAEPWREQLLDELRASNDQKAAASYLEIQMGALGEAVAVYENYARNGRSDELVLFAKMRLPALNEHLGKVEEFYGALAASAPVAVVVPATDPALVVQRLAPQVAVAQAATQVTVQQSVGGQGEIVVHQKPAIVTIDIPQPEITIVQGDATIAPVVRYDRVEPQVVISQSEGAPEVRIEQGIAATEDAGAIVEEVAPESQPVAAARGSERLVGRVVGMAVQTEAGDDVGEVGSVLVDPGTAERFIVISAGGFLGIGGSELALPIERFRLADDHVVVISVSDAEAAAMPSYVEDSGEEMAEDEAIFIRPVGARDPEE